MQTIRRAFVAPIAMIGIMAITNSGAAAQTPGYTILYSFQGGEDGSGPSGVTLARDGGLYGATSYGGPNTCEGAAFSCGTVYELEPGPGGIWTKTVLHNFSGPDGAVPNLSGGVVGAPGPSLLPGPGGVLYGTTYTGGAYDPTALGPAGTVFELTPPTAAGQEWTETVLHSFPENGPNIPSGRLLLGSEGAIYGTTLSSGEEPVVGAIFGGTVFRLLPPVTPQGNWTERNLINFYPATSLGTSPEASVVRSSGSLFGTNYWTSSQHGGEGCGVAYQLSAPATGDTWTGTAIYAFGDGPGCNPAASLTVGPNGVFYGTTYGGGTGRAGTVFQLTPPSTAGGAWSETTIYNFTGPNGDGAYPAASLVLGSNGVLYGSTSAGGNPSSCFGGGCGIVYELSPPATPGGTWTETILHAFTGQNGDGSFPGPLTLAPNGVLFGPTWSGGAAGAGTVFALRP